MSGSPSKRQRKYLESPKCAKQAESLASIQLEHLMQTRGNSH